MNLEELFATTTAKTNKFEFVLLSDKGSAAVYIDHDSAVTILIPHRLLKTQEAETNGSLI